MTNARWRSGAWIWNRKLGSQVPLDLEFRDAAGRTVALKEYFGRRPVILILVYYSCEDLCPLVLEGLVQSLRPLAFNIGDQFDVVTVKLRFPGHPCLGGGEKERCLKQYGRPGAADGWHFLTGDETAIRRLTEAVGFRYNYESDRDRFGHAAGIVLLTPAGQGRALFLRHRVFAAGFASGPDRSFRQQNRFAHRSAFALLLSLRSCHRKVQFADHEYHPSRWRRPPCSRSPLLCA